MATGKFSLYALDGITPVVVPQPEDATWQRIERGRNGDGSIRYARRVVVQWAYSHAMSAADFQKFTTYRSASGLVYFETWRKPIGATPGGFVVVRGVMDEPSGVLVRGEYHGVSIRVVQVEEA